MNGTDVGFQDFSVAQLILGMQVCSVFWAVFSTFGIVTNFLNILTFLTMGVTDGMTISFLLMSVTDLSFLLVSMALSFSTGFYVLETISDFWLRYMPYNIGLFFANLIVPLTAIISLQTSFIAIARCLCVAAPFYFKDVLTRQLTMAFMIFFFIFAAVTYAPVFVYMGVIDKFDSRKNVYRPTVWISPLREPVKNIVWNILAMVIPLASQLIVIISLVVMAMALKESLRFRLTSSSLGATLSLSVRRHNNANIKSAAAANKLSVKDLHIVQQVALISTMHIICQTPKIMFIITGIILPEFNFNRALYNFYLTMSNTRLIFEMINSAFTFPIYFRYNAKFRKTVLKHLQCK